MPEVKHSGIKKIYKQPLTRSSGSGALCVNVSTPASNKRKSSRYSFAYAGYRKILWHRYIGMN